MQNMLIRTIEKRAHLLKFRMRAQNFLATATSKFGQTWCDFRIRAFSKLAQLEIRCLAGRLLINRLENRDVRFSD